MGARKVIKEFFITSIEKARDFFGFRKPLELGEQREQKDKNEEFKNDVKEELSKKEKRLEKENEEVAPKRKIYNLSSKEIYERQAKTKKQDETLQKYYDKEERMRRARIKRLERIRGNQARNHQTPKNRIYRPSTNSRNSMTRNKSTNSRNIVKNIRSTNSQSLTKRQTNINSNITGKRNIKQQDKIDKSKRKIKQLNSRDRIDKIEQKKRIEKDKIIQYDARDRIDKIIQYDAKYRNKFQRMQKAYDKSHIYKVIDGGITGKKKQTSKKENDVRNFKDGYSFVIQPPKTNQNNEAGKNINTQISKDENRGLENDLKNFFDF